MVFTGLLLGWLALMFFFSKHELNVRDCFRDIFSLCTLYGIFLLNNLYLFKRLFSKKWWIIYFIAMGAVFIADQYTGRGIYWLFSETFYAKSYTINRFFMVYISLALHYAFLYYQQRQQILEFQLLKREVELTQLKTQLNPHFLYNALNNIYSYLLINEDGKGKELILKLSELMRHLTESSDKKEVTLEESIIFLKNYIAFEQERLGNRCQVDVRISVKNGNDFKITPLLFFPLVENAFKHGTNTIGTSQVGIKIELKGNELYVEIKNSIIGEPDLVKTGKGLPNVCRQLDLLYENKHHLEIKQDGMMHYVVLKLNLS